MEIPDTPSRAVRVACVAVGLVVLAGAAVAAADLAGTGGRPVAAVAPAIGDGIDGTPIEFDVPPGWIRADPDAEMAELTGASRATVALLDERRRAAAAAGVPALMFDLDTLGHMEVTYALVEEPSAAAAQAAEDRRELLEASEGVEVLDVREIELAAAPGYAIRVVVGSGAATNHRLQIITPFDRGYAVFSAQSSDPAALDDVLQIAPSIRIG